MKPTKPMTIKEAKAFRNECKTSCSKTWLHYTESYIVHFTIDSQPNQETFLFNGKGDHEMVEQRFRELHAKEMDRIKIKSVDYQ